MEVAGALAALAVVVALAYLLAPLLKRVHSVTGRTADPRFVRAVPLGPRERLVVIRWGQETLLLGVTAGQITLLDRRATLDGETDEQLPVLPMLVRFWKREKPPSPP